MNHLYLRDWPAAAAGYKRALEITPDLDSEIGLAYLEVVQNHNPAAGRNILQSTLPAIDPDEGQVSAGWDLAMLERDYATAENILRDLPLEKFHTRDVPKTSYQGRTALARGDEESAQRYFAAATPVFEGRVRDDPADPENYADLGLLYAYMPFGRPIWPSSMHLSANPTRRSR